jgi:uncharacterized RDD family membrane protein YckC
MIETTNDKLIDFENKLAPVPMHIRLGNFIIDAILINIFATGVNMIFPYLPAENQVKNMMLSNDITGMLHFIKIQFGVSVLLNIFYYFPLELAGKATFGKLLTNTRVISANGKICSPAQIFIRTLCRCIPFDGISFLFTNGIGWHDSISKTRVIAKSQFESINNGIDHF